MSEIVIQAGRCGQAGCLVQHPVEPVASPWVNALAEPQVQYRGVHHGQPYIYERWMVTR